MLLVSLENSPAVSNHDLWQMLRKRVTEKGREQQDLEFAILSAERNQLLWGFGDESCMQMIIQRCHLSHVHSDSCFLNPFSCGWLTPQAVSKYHATTLCQYEKGLPSACF